MSDVIGVLHPGSMGAAVAGFLASRGNEVLWVSEGRSPASRDRARSAGLTEVETLNALVQRSTLILSICPPEFATEVAEQVLAEGFHGTYCDANAIAPRTAEAIAELVESAGAHFVDGGIIGNPPSPTAKTRLYFSGSNAQDVANLFANGGGVRAISLEGDRTGASALKMCFAGWTKGTQALILAVRATAKANGVEDALLAEWAYSQPDALEKSEFARKSIFKAWRFAGEMREIAECFSDSGVTGDIHLGAAKVFESCAELKDMPAPEMDAILKLIRHSR